MTIKLTPDEAPQQTDELATLRARVKELERETIDAALRAWPETNDVGAEPGLLIDELAGERDALRAELESIRKEAETNQKWAFLEWRDKAERAEAENARLREALDDARDIIFSLVSGRGCEYEDTPESAVAFIDAALARTEAENA